MNVFDLWELRTIFVFLMGMAAGAVLVVVGCALVHSPREYDRG